MAGGNTLYPGIDIIAKTALMTSRGDLLAGTTQILAIRGRHGTILTVNFLGILMLRSHRHFQLIKLNTHKHIKRKITHTKIAPTFLIKN